MPAFRYQILNLLKSNVRQLYYRRQTLGRHNMTHEEFIQCFVPAPQRQLFRDIAPYTYQSTDWHDVRWYSPGAPHHTDIRLTMRDQETTRAPPYPNDMVQQLDAPQEVVERVSAWIANGGDVSRDFGRVDKVLDMLNEKCSQQGMRYYWPSIIALCSLHNETKPYAAELQELKVPSSVKPLPRGLLQACRITSETIATAMLIPEDASTPPLSQVTMIVATGKTFDEPDLGRFMGLN